MNNRTILVVDEVSEILAASNGLWNGQDSQRCGSRSSPGMRRNDLPLGRRNLSELSRWLCRK